MFRKILQTTNDPTLTVARVVLATIFFAHGSQKMFGLFGGRGFSGTLELFELRLLDRAHLGRVGSPFLSILDEILPEAA